MNKFHKQLRACVIVLIALCVSATAQWQPAGSINASAIRHLLYVEPNILVCTAAGGVYKSTDDGFSFQQSKIGLLSANVWGILPFGDSLYAYSENGVFVSDRSASLWKTIKSGLPSNGIISMEHHGGKLFAGSSTFGCYMWNPSLGTWTSKSKGLPQSGLIALLDMDDFLVAGTTEHGVYVSGDLGETWIEANGGLLPPVVESLTRYKNSIVAGMYTRGAYRSDDSASTWKKFNTGIDTVNTLTTKVIDGELFLCAENGLFQFDTVNAVWHDVSVGLGSKIVETIVGTKSSLLVGTFRGTIWKRPKSELMTVAVESDYSATSAAPEVQVCYDGTSNIIRATLFSCDESPQAVRVFSLSGRLMASSVRSDVNTTPAEMFISASDFADGIYICQVQTARAKVSRMFSIVR